jgi:TolB-like protein
MKNLIYAVILITCMPILAVYSVDNDNMIKRNVLVVPFVNSSNDQDYNYLKETIIDAVKANLMNTNRFNLSNPVEINNMMRKMKIDNEKILEPSNAIKLAGLVKADIVVIGKYLAIDEKIMIQIQAIDVFTGETGIIMNEQGSLGINLLKLIDMVSKDLSIKMSLKFPEVDRTYFTEMTRIMNEKNRIKFNFTAQTASGMALCISGSLMLTSGLTLLIYDLTGYSVIKQADYDNYKITFAQVDFQRSLDSYNVFIGMFVAGVILSSSGLIMAAISIPLLVYKKKIAKVSMNLGFYPEFGLSISYKL